MSKYFLTVMLLIVSLKIFSQDSVPLINSDFIKLENPSETDLSYILIIDSTMRIFSQDYEITIDEYFKAYGNLDNFKYDYTPTLTFLKSFYYGDYDLVVKRFAAFKLSDFLLTEFKIEEHESMFASDCIKLLKPNDVIWSLNPEAVLYFNNLNTNLALNKFIKSKNKALAEFNQEELDNYTRLLMDKYISYGNDLYHNNLDRKVRAYALIYLIQMLHSLDRKDIASEYYYKLLNEFSDIEDVKKIIIEYNPSDKLSPGNLAPSFEGELLKSGDKISSEMLKGKYLLIYFWATWCPPCIVRMEALHKIYNKYSSSNFTIISFSLDHSDDIVKKFQKEKWEMPWFNVRLKNGFEDNIAQEFELNGVVPKMLLVDPDGIILEDNSSNIKDNLDSTISKYLPK